MRNRFFLIIFLTIILAAVSFNGVTTYFFRNERIHLIDYQIQRVADTLMHSEDFKNNLSMPSEQLDHVITDILGPGRIGKVYILRDLSGTIIYESFNVALLQTPLPIDPPWLTVGARDQYVRIFNAHVSNDRILQVGMVLDNNFVNWRIFDARTLGLIFLLVIGLFGISAALTLVLMSPIRILPSSASTAGKKAKNVFLLNKKSKKRCRSLITKTSLSIKKLQRSF